MGVNDGDVAVDGGLGVGQAGNCMAGPLASRR